MATERTEEGQLIITVLNSWEEEACLRSMKKTALKNCDEFVSAFAECSKHGTVRVFFACQATNKAMNDCLRQFTTDETLDKLREKALDDKIARLQSGQQKPPNDANLLHPIFRRNKK
ncbi:hypothetical protein SmJEL517_g02662 [Synchytrium microbalum]|uniref:COX assembly mitochondrial protein n=1 Tax=Synchytrium microbalum TaxID=1806994 RepID=A0A507CAU2_9FUNG|nr:uncharacterized protein SmJEL517_g02662 [Synchytrium microbalum]TPX34643.1 hypothetical protein SmJEL517_g02662 [Synchytrium microbalum]